VSSKSTSCHGDGADRVGVLGELKGLSGTLERVGGDGGGERKLRSGRCVDSSSGVESLALISIASTETRHTHTGASA